MKIAGIKIPKTFELENAKLPYRGGALRTKLFIKTYIAAFYSEENFTSVSEAHMSDSPKVMKQHVMTNLITGKLLAESFKDGLKKTAISRDPSIQGELQEMLQFMGEIQVKVHDEMDIVYHPESKLKIYFNGDLQMESEKTLLAHALFGMFLGEKHPDKRFQKKLIGQ